MKLILAFALAAAATTAYGESAGDVQPKAPKKSRTAAVLSIARHADSWCHLHHQSGGAAGCTKHPGCSYSKTVDELFIKETAKLTTKTQDLATLTGKAKTDLAAKLDTLRENLDTYGPCHSSDHHEHKWCDFYGSKDTKSCIGLSMCTWKVGDKDKDGNRAKGKCKSEVTDEDFPQIKAECFNNMGLEKATADGYGADEDYVGWKECIVKSKKSPDGNKCVKLSCFQKPGSCKTVEKQDPITQTAVWFPAKEPCDSYKTCKRDTNIVPNARCAEGFGFLWELPSNKAIKTRTGEKENTKVGTHEFGCRELYNYKANCAKIAVKRCVTTGINGVKKECATNVQCDKGDTCKVTADFKYSEQYMANQYDEDKLGFDGYFCVDADGHEIPDTRKMRPVELFDISCDIQRKKNDGMQCPNAVTLSTRGGLAVVNKKRGNKKCDSAVTCNSDTDCKGEKWCCFNGCGYQCKLPVKPLSGCAALPGTKNKQVAEQKWQIVNDSGAGTGEKRRHGIKIMVKCGKNFAQIPSKAGEMPVQQMELVCEHGEWAHCPSREDQDCVKGEAMEKLLTCSKDCEPFQLVDTQVNVIEGGKSKSITIPATVESSRSGKDLYSETKPLRQRDFVETARSGFEAVVGDADKLRHHTATRTISCPTGYGAVQHQKFLGLGRFKAVKKDPRSMHIVRHGYETLECKEGNWTPRRLECSICYDAYEWQWRDMKGNSCAFYRSRPLECHNTVSQVISEGASTGENCGTYSVGWKEQGRFMLNKGMINAKQYRKYFQPWGDIRFMKSSEAQKKYDVKRKFWKKPRGKRAKKKNSPRECTCLPFFQPSYSDALKEDSSSPSSDCGQITRGKKVFVNPNNGKKLTGKQGKFFYMQQSSFGNAADNCRVACRSCEDAESKYLLRTSYDKDEFQMFLSEGKIKAENVDPEVMEGGTADKGSGGKWKMVKRRVLKWTTIPTKTSVTKTISKSYAISKVCTDGQGGNFLKCVSNDVRSICSGSDIDESGCKKGFTPMA